MKVIGSPVDQWVDPSEPWFSKNEVIFSQVVDEGVEVVRVVVAIEVNAGGVRGDGEGAIRENDRNGLVGMGWDGVFGLE